MSLYLSKIGSSSTEVEDKLFFRVQDRCSSFLQELRMELIAGYNLEKDWKPDKSFLNEGSATTKGRSYDFEKCYYNSEEYNVLEKPMIEIIPETKNEYKSSENDLYLLEFMKKIEQYNLNLLQSKSQIEWHCVNCRKCRKIREKYLGKSLENDSRKHEDKLKTATMPSDMIALWGDMLQDLNRLKAMNPWDAIRLRIAELERDVLHRTKKS